MITRSMSPISRILRAFSRRPASRVSSSISVAKPMMPLSGVRSSWPMLARKVDFAVFFCSAWMRSFSASR